LALTSLPLNHQLEDESTVFFFPLLPPLKRVESSAKPTTLKGLGGHCPPS